MYDFIDTTEVSEGYTLPSEALSINGEYIEDLIPGYRTLHVSGREALSPEISSYSTGVRDGSIFKNKRYPKRIITVTYQLIAESDNAFRAAYNELGNILNVNDAQLIFNDETDVYYTGTPSYIGDVEPGTNSVVGEFEITCLDPFKYSVIEYEAEADIEDNSILIDYQGTYKAFPILEAELYSEGDINEDGTAGNLTGAGDCGYVAFFTEDEQIIQLGDPDENDGVERPKSETLINQSFKNTSAWNTTAQALWSLNPSGVPSDITQVGALAMNAASWDITTATNTSGTLLSKASEIGPPTMNYKITAKTSNRTDTSVKVNISITVSLSKSSSYFGHGYSLQGSIYIGGSWHNVTLKTTSEYWKGTSAHTKNITVTVTGLTSSQTSITGIKFKSTRPDGLGTVGTLSETSCNNLTISVASTKTANSYYLSPSSYGSGSAWHGPAIKRTLPADSVGDTGSTDFTLSYTQKMSGANSQLGSFQIHCLDASGNSIVGVQVHKNKTGTKITLTYYLNGASMGSKEIDISKFNDKASKITKSASKITFEIGGVVKAFTKSIETLVTDICISFSQYSTKTALEYNGIYDVKFVKVNADTYKDVPNKFSANDIVEADCSTGEVYLNGILTPSLGALGNDWETFILTPGLNQIGTSYSEWVEDEYKPTFKIRYREVFL